MTFTTLGYTTCYQDECRPEIKRHTMCLLHRGSPFSPKESTFIGLHLVNNLLHRQIVFSSFKNYVAVFNVIICKSRVFISTYFIYHPYAKNCRIAPFIELSLVHWSHVLLWVKWWEHFYSVSVVTTQHLNWFQDHLEKKMLLEWEKQKIANLKLPEHQRE